MRSSSKYEPGVDKKNLTQIKSIVKKYGWPTISMVGKSGARGAWLIAQHADKDAKFQKSTLRLMITNEKNGEAEKKYIAYLTDRVLVNTKKSQLFGTQFYLNKQNNFVPRKIRDKNNLNKRRRMFDLNLFSEYEKKILAVYKK